jgi:hypothetical protein
LQKVPDMKFKASLDNTAKIISGLILALPLILFLFKSESVWADLLLLSIFFICYGYAPQYYTLTNSELIIKRFLKPVHIPLAEIKTVSAIPEAKKMANGSIRTFGVGGLFGYFGKFWNKESGKMTWYVTNFKNVIAIETKAGTTILISPDNPEMLRVLKKKLPNGQPQAA